MNEEREKKLAEWYGTGPFARPEAEPPVCAQSVPPRSRHLGWKITGLCVLAVFVIAATALLFSSGVNALLPILSEKLPPEGGQSSRRYRGGMSATGAIRSPLPVMRAQPPVRRYPVSLPSPSASAFRRTMSEAP